jgi:hypothetical protein
MRGIPDVLLFPESSYDDDPYTRREIFKDYNKTFASGMVYGGFDEDQTSLNELPNTHEETIFSTVRAMAFNSDHSPRSSTHEDSFSLDLEAFSDPDDSTTPPPHETTHSPAERHPSPRQEIFIVISESEPESGSESESDSDSDFVDVVQDKRARKSNGETGRVDRVDRSTGKTPARKRNGDFADSNIHRSPRRARLQITTVTNLEVTLSSPDSDAAANGGGTKGSLVTTNDASNQPQGSRVPKSFPCIHVGCPQICKSAGDLKRHLESRQHKTPSYHCKGCGAVTYTRLDALRRHHRNKPDCASKHRSRMAKQENED